jgi:hypothetical protein
MGSLRELIHEEIKSSERVFRKAVEEYKHEADTAVRKFKSHRAFDYDCGAVEIYSFLGPVVSRIQHMSKGTIDVSVCEVGGDFVSCQDTDPHMFMLIASSDCNMVHHLREAIDYGLDELTRDGMLQHVYARVKLERTTCESVAYVFMTMRP